MTDNLIPSKIDAWGIKANGSETEKCLWSVNFTDSDYNDLQMNSIYNTLILKADFKCLLGNYRMKTGSYGLKIRLIEKVTNDNNKAISQWVNLDSSDMFGNPYSFLVYSTQEATFDISNVGKIEAISLYLYQNDDFVYYENDGSQKRIEPANFDNILAKNIYVSFGSDLTKVEDNTLQIYTGDSLLYNETDATDNSREIGLIWYNKDEDNTYVGFSDGLYAPNYDEITYLEESEVDSRLTAQMGKDIPDDEIALEISADIEDAQPIFKNLRNALTRDLRNNIQAFQDQITSLTHYKDDFIDLLGSISDLGEHLENLQATMNTEYAEILSAARKIQEGTIVPKPNQTVVISPTGNNSQTSIAEKITSVITSVDVLLSQIRADIRANYSGFMSVYDTYETRIKKVEATISTYVGQLQYLLDDDVNKMSNFFLPGYSFEPYNKTDFSAYDNKYCIYWYRYEPGYISADELFMEKGWHRLSDKNLGVPRTRLTEDSEYNAKKVLAPDGILLRNLSTEYTEEKYIALLFYNHTMYKSNIITFINQNPPIDEKIVDSSDACKIEHSDNSQPSYQMYGLNNLLVNAADGYRKRKLLLRYEGKTAGDEALYGAQIFWYVPKNATMLKYELEDFDANWSNDEKLTPGINFPYSKPGYVCFYRTIGGTEIEEEIEGTDQTRIRYEINSDDRCFIYRIKDYYSQTFTNNTIQCRIVKSNSYDYTTDISFVFSSFGTSGTDYTLVVSPQGEKPAVDADGLTLGVALYDYNNERKFILDSAPAIDNMDPYLMLPIGCEGPSGYGISTGEYKIGKDEYGVETLLVSKVTDCYYGVLKAVVPYMVDELNQIVNLITYCPIPYTAGNYYIEGPSVVVYESDGNKPTYYKNPFKIFYRTSDEENEIVADTERTNVMWSMMYYDEDGVEMTAEKWGDSKYAVLKSYMPTLNDQNCLVPCNIYLENNSNVNVYPVVVCRDSENVVLWAQPIYCMKNRYASAMLNKWDGSFKIDEENGTILSTMVGAGRKNSENQFEGVLMGDVGSASEDNATGVGLYGFHNGAQSYNFNVDGTAFIGKSGRGRIKFNGDKGTITSASYEQAKESAGMMIDLDDGVIDMRGAKIDATTGKYVADTASRIHIDVKSPYFKIDSVKGKTLMFIGGEKEGYYLQSDDFEPTVFNFNETASNSQGKGMKIDLKNGRVDAYEFTLASKNIYLNSGNDATNYFVIKDNDNNMIFHAGKNDYYLKSADYTAGEAGTMINLSEGKIDSYDFSLVSSKVILSTSNPYFKVVGTRTDGEPLMLVSDTDFYIQDNEGNMSINLDDGSILATNFTLTAGNDNQVLTVSSDPSLRPLQVSGGKDTFYVDWAGNVHCTNLQATGGSFTGKIVATSGSFTGTIKGATILGGTLDIGSAGETAGSGKFSVASDGSITIGNKDTFHVTSGGALTCTSATIGGWKVGTGTSDGFRVAGLTMSPTTGLDFKGLFTVDQNGITTIDNLVVAQTLTVKGSRAGAEVLKVTNTGQLTIQGALKIKGNIDMGGSGYKIMSGTAATTWFACFDNGVWAKGNLLTIDTSFCQIGQSSTCEVTLLSGSKFTFGTGSSVYLAAPSSTYVWDGSYTSLPNYIKKYSKSLLNITIGDDSDSGGIVGEAAKVSNALTLTLNGVNLLSYDGSATRTLDFGSLAFKDNVDDRIREIASGYGFPGGATDTITYTNPNGNSYVAHFSNGLFTGIW